MHDGDVTVGRRGGGVGGSGEVVGGGGGGVGGWHWDPSGTWGRGGGRDVYPAFLLPETENRLQRTKIYQQSVTLVARMWPEDEGTPPPMSASSGTYPGGGLLGGVDDAAAAAAGGGGVGGGWQWGRWRVSEDQLPLAVGALAGGALLILAIVAAALWRCCTLSPRNAKASYCVRIGEEEAARQTRPRVAAVASHESAVYLDPKSNQWSHNSRLVVTTATATSPTGTTQSVQSTQTCAPTVTRSAEVTKGGQAVIVSHPQPQCSTEEGQPDPARQQGSHISHPPPLPPQHVTPSMGSLTMTPPPHWFYDSRVLSQSTLERLDPAASTSSPRAPQRVPHENGVTVWSGMGCDPSGRRRPLSQPSCFGPCNRHHNVQVMHSQPPSQFQQQHYHPNMQGGHSIQTSSHQQQMHHPHAHHHIVMSLPQHQQESSGEPNHSSQQPQQNHQHQVHLPEIPEFCHSGSQYASSGVLDEVSGARQYDVVGGEGLGGAEGANGAETAALKTRSLPAWVRSRSRPLSTEDDLAELYAKVNLSKKRKNRMRSDEAAIIALSKSRSQFLPIPPCHSHHAAAPSASAIAVPLPSSSSITHRCHRDTDSLVDHEAVIVYDERTAL
ncbi:uncharacterized protein [Hetaerina americana]|uniref:uncharacterized protein n=1 Tax=Hetaerina americana TaxID=62018 RepID=UPI003A7F33A6